MRTKMTTRSSLAAIAAVMLFPFSANALGISIVDVTSSGASTSLLDVGDVLTLSLRVENPDNTQVFGLGITAEGYDAGSQGFPSDNRLIFQGGQASESVFNAIIDQGVPLGGLDNVQGGVVELGGPGPLPPPSTRIVSLFSGVSTSGASGDGSSDLGVDGAVTTDPGDVHFRISFAGQALALPGDVTLDFRGDAIGNGGVLLPFEGDSFTVRVVPEPGTALLMGLGLAALGVRRR